jgi:hypothetical protein
LEEYSVSGKDGSEDRGKSLISAATAVRSDKRTFKDAEPSKIGQHEETVAVSESTTDQTGGTHEESDESQSMKDWRAGHVPFMGPPSADRKGEVTMIEADGASSLNETELSGNSHAFLNHNENSIGNVGSVISEELRKLLDRMEMWEKRKTNAAQALEQTSDNASSSDSGFLQEGIGDAGSRVSAGDNSARSNTVVSRGEERIREAAELPPTGAADIQNSLRNFREKAAVFLAQSTLAREREQARQREQAAKMARMRAKMKENQREATSPVVVAGPRDPAVATIVEETELNDSLEGEAQDSRVRKVVREDSAP